MAFIKAKTKKKFLHMSIYILYDLHSKLSNYILFRENYKLIKRRYK